MNKLKEMINICCVTDFPWKEERKSRYARSARYGFWLLIHRIIISSAAAASSSPDTELRFWSIWINTCNNSAMWRIVFIAIQVEKVPVTIIASYCWEFIIIMMSRITRQIYMNEYACYNSQMQYNKIFTGLQ